GGAGGVDPNSHGWGEAGGLAVLRELPLDRDGAGEGFVGGFKSNEEAVAGGDDLLPSVGGELGPEGLVVDTEDALPGLVAEGFDQVRRLHDVGEHERLLDPSWCGAASELPREELVDLLDHDRLRGAGERDGLEQLLLDGLDLEDRGLRVVGLLPVE